MSYCFDCGCYECCSCEVEENKRDWIWIQRNGQQCKVSEMETSHIKNSIVMIEKSGGTWRAEYLPVLQDELKLRETKLWKVL